MLVISVKFVLNPSRFLIIYFSLLSEKINIPNKRGQVLAACLDSPEGSKPKTYAIFAHCFTCSKDLKAISNINYSLSVHGIAVLRFDMTGIGESEGIFEETNFTTQLQDFAAVTEFVSAKYEKPKLAIGHSLGGCVAINSARSIDSFKAVAVIASPPEPSALSVKLKKTREQAFKEGIAEREIGGVKYKFTPQFFEDIESYSLKQDIQNLKKPLLILHSPADTYSHISNSEIIYDLASQPKSLVSLDDIDHLMLKKSDARYVGNLIGSWFAKYNK